QGRESWYGKVTVNGRQVKRRLGRVRQRGSSEGLTRPQALKALRALATETGRAVPRDQRMTVKEAGDLYLRDLEEVKSRKPTTLTGYRSYLDVHIEPFFRGKKIDAIDHHLIDAFVSAKLAEGLAHKSVMNLLTFMHGLFRFAVRKGWATSNPAADAERPEPPDKSSEIRFLTPEELAALYRAAPSPSPEAHESDPERVCAVFWASDRVLFQVAAMTGLRQGELVGLRWRDVEWTKGQIRVRQTFTAGRWSTPKSTTSVRGVPMADAVAGELERHHQASAFTDDDDLVFAHPELGTVLDASALRRRFKRALTRAGLREARFHDLRHSFGTAMASAGAPMRAIQEWMGHASITTTEIYAQWGEDPTNGKKWAAEAFDTTEPVVLTVVPN
ncbi:MAG: tyrosine-type recombinase/integrase, partial [Thermoleophilia bacterium]